MATKTNWIVSIPNISSPGSFEEEDFDSLVEAQQFLLQWYGTVRSIPEGLICENTYEVDSEEDEESEEENEDDYNAWAWRERNRK